MPQVIRHREEKREAKGSEKWEAKHASVYLSAIIQKFRPLVEKVNIKIDRRPLSTVPFTKGRTEHKHIYFHL